MIHFAYNRSSWDEEADCALPGSMFDLIAQPVMKELTSKGVDFSVGREPLPGRFNLYASARGGFNTRDEPIGEISTLMNHGIADKGIRSFMKGQFGYVIASSPRIAQSMTARGIHRRHIVTLGYPKLDPLFNGEVQGTGRDGRIRVLYAPTQGGGGDMEHMFDTAPPDLAAAAMSSWWRRDEVVAGLDPDIFDVVMCPHPRYTPGHVATLEQYVDADVVIADGGSTLWESMALGIPIVVPRWITGPGHDGHPTMEGEIYSQAVGRHAASPDAVAELCRHAAEDGPGSLETRYAEIGLPQEFRGVSGAMHASWILDAASSMLD